MHHLQHSPRRAPFRELRLLLWCLSAAACLGPSLTHPAAGPAPVPVKIAVFDFELDDLSPEAVYLYKTTTDPGVMEKVTNEARRVLAASGRYRIIDIPKGDSRAQAAKPLRKCDGCEAHIAAELGADESMIGVVSKVTQTDYYVVIQIREAATGKVLDQQEANFAGAEDGWPSGVRMLIRHQVLLE
jgi:Protein of unknown function (DUF2380)